MTNNETKVTRLFSGGQAERFSTVDGLRGIAALVVALYHIHIPAFKDIDSTSTILLSSIFQFGYLGVPIFFVISGFVIAATVKPAEVTFKYIGKFIIKRATRLDPPYWLSIALDIFLIYLTIQLFHITSHLPSIPQVASHLFYLQNLLGYGDIAANYYTLCFEVQFYIFFSLVFAVGGNVRNLFSSQLYTIFIVFILGITTLYSLLITAELAANPIAGLFLSHWYLFMLGAACYWTSIKRSISKHVFFAYCMLVFALFLFDVGDRLYHSLNTLAALLTALLLYAAATKNKMSTWLSSRPLLYFGSISYSLYLFHGIVGDRTIAFFREWLLPRLSIQINSATAILLFFLALALAILASHLVYTFIEKPSVKISRKIKPASRTSIISDIRISETALPVNANITGVRPILP